MAGENDGPDSIRNLLTAATEGSLTSQGGAPGGDPADIGDGGVPTKPPESPDTGQGADQSDAAKAHRAEQAASRTRDEAGRFAAKPPEKPGTRETLSLKEKPSAPTDRMQAAPSAKAPEVAANQQDLAPKQGEEAILPPAEWKGAGKVQWNKLPKPVQAELRATYDGLASERADVTAARAAFEPLQRAIAPHQAVLMRDAGSVESGITQLMEFYNLFLTRPVDLIQHIARTRGIDLGAPQGQQPSPDGSTPQPVPDITSLIRQALQQEVAPIKEQLQQRETQQLQSTIEAFRADPKHPYFEDVKVHMGQLLNIGAAKDMQAAYDQAIWADPVIRQQLLEASAESTKTAQAAEVQRAKDAAAASLRGSPLANGASAPAGNGSDGSIRGDLMAAIRQQQGAV